MTSRCTRFFVSRMSLVTYVAAALTLALTSAAAAPHDSDTGQPTSLSHQHPVRSVDVTGRLNAHALPVADAIIPRLAERTTLNVDVRLRTSVPEVISYVGLEGRRWDSLERSRDAAGAGADEAGGGDKLQSLVGTGGIEREVVLPESPLATSQRIFAIQNSAQLENQLLTETSGHSKNLADEEQFIEAVNSTDELQAPSKVLLFRSETLESDGDLIDSEDKLDNSVSQSYYYEEEESYADGEYDAVSASQPLGLEHSLGGSAVVPQQDSVLRTNNDRLPRTSKELDKNDKADNNKELDTNEELDKNEQLDKSLAKSVGLHAAQNNQTDQHRTDYNRTVSSPSISDLYIRSSLQTNPGLGLSTDQWISTEPEVNGTWDGMGSTTDSRGNQSAWLTSRLPQAIIIGVKKGGTRALLEFLRIHPDVRAPGPEIHFFDRNYDKGLEWYRCQMPPTTPAQITIEKTPSYFVTRSAPARVRAMAPSTRLIVVVRDPVTRAISDYAQVRAKRPSMASFSRMAFLDNTTLGPVATSWGAVKIGVYSRHLARWLKHFPLHRFHFVHGERLVSDPAGELALLQDFLGLERRVTRRHFYFDSAKGFPCLRRTNLEENSAGNSIVSSRLLYGNSQVGGTDSAVIAVNQSSSESVSIMPNPQSMGNSSAVRDNPSAADEARESSAGAGNSPRCLGKTKGRIHPDVDAAVLRRLRDFFRPFNEKFYRMTRVNFGWPY